MSAVSLDLVTDRVKDPLHAYLNTLGLPGNKTEQYRHFAVKPLLEREYTLKTVETHAPAEGKSLVIKNGCVTEIPAGVSVTYATPFEADTAHYDALYFMSHMLAPAVISLEITQDVTFEIRHIIDESAALLPYRLYVSVVENSSAEIFETFETDASKESLLLYGLDTEVQAHATLRWVRSQSGGAEETAVIGSHRYDVKANGTLELKTFDFGAMQALHLYKIDLGEYAHCNADHLLMATGKAKRGNVVHINLNSPNVKCLQNARTILKDKATGIFDGLVRVGKEAFYANAHQHSQAVLLNAGAYMYAKPQLEIYTEELEASHGATIGALDEKALFYLLSRGIEETEARKMLVLAFADVVINSVGDGALAEKIHADFEQAYFAE